MGDILNGNNIVSKSQYFTCSLALFFVYNPLVYAKAIETNPPSKTVKLIYIHHSCGENLLNDNDGGFGHALLKNRYFVSDTNYGWGPSNIGDRTDILNWPEWFSSSKTSKYMKALLQDSNDSIAKSVLTKEK